MSLNETVSAERIHIGFFGMRNAGKSSVVNAVTQQELAVVSDIKGTTTDPVRKAMELLPLGPVVIIDTPGFDDEGALGELRVKKTRQVLNTVDLAVLVVDGTKGLSSPDLQLLQIFSEKNIPYVIVYNKADLFWDAGKETAAASQLPEHLKKPAGTSGPAQDLLSHAAQICVSAREHTHIHELKELLAHMARQEKSQKRLVADLLSPGDLIILVVPIDSAAPKGRLILPQQLTIRDILDAGAIPVITRDTELEKTLASLAVPPRMVITDSQVFEKVAAVLPADYLLTSFSILMLRYKGNLAEAVNGAKALSHLRDGDKILISEGCTHHRQCGDIGPVKLPKWLENYTGKRLSYEFTSGTQYPEDVSSYELVIHCGGCMLNEREMQSRVRRTADQGVPITNYGIAIAKMHGILERSLEPFSTC